MRMEIQMRSGHSFWAKNRQNSDIVDIQGLRSSYLDSNEHEFTVPSQSRPQLLRPCLMRKYRGRCHWKVPWVFGVQILCKHDCPFLCNCPSQPAADVRIGGISPLIAPQTRRFTRGILSTDGRIDREGYGQVYQIWLCIRRGRSPIWWPARH